MGPIMKPKLSVYLSDHVAERLALAAKRPGTNRSAIVDASGDGALVRRLDRISRQLDRLDRDSAIMAETMALFVRYYLTITPPLPSGDQEAARALGRERFEIFVAQVGKRVASGGRLVADIMERVSASNPDLFMRHLEEGAPLGPSTPEKENPSVDTEGQLPGHPPAGREEVGNV